MTLYPAQDTFVRGEISPRLHARASLDLYRAGLSKCLNFITLPHGGIRKRGGSYFVGEVKTSAKKTRLIPFVFSAEQAYALEFGDLYIRVYAYGARVGTVEVVSPYAETELAALQFEQSGDVMWITHANHRVRSLTREAHTTWTLAEYSLKDGPFGPVNDTATTLTPAATGAVHPIMTGSTAPSGTAAGSSDSANAYKAFDTDKATGWNPNDSPAILSYDFAGTATKVCDAYWVKVRPSGDTANAPVSWTFDGFDGTNWVTLDGRQNETGWSRGEVRFYVFDNKTAFQSYRFNVNGSEAETGTNVAETGWHESGDTMTPFNLTASAPTGINDGAGFQTSDVGRLIRLRGTDGNWRWAKIVARTSSTVVTIRLYGHALPDLTPIATWRMGAFGDVVQAEGISLFEERLAISQRFSVFASKTGGFDNFAIGEADDAGLEFRNAGGGQANDIVWLADADGFLLIATTGGVRSLSGSGIDEALTPSSFKNRKSRTHGCARIRPIDAGTSFLYVTRSRKSIAELVQNSSGRFTSEDIGQISEHIPKRGVVEIVYQSDPDPFLWFPLENGELGGFTHQPAQEVRGMHRHNISGGFSGSLWGIVESAAVTPGQDGVDDLWLIVKRTINGATKRYIEIVQAAFEYGAVEDAFEVDCGLTYAGSAVGTLSGLSHLEGQTVDVLANAKVYKGLVVASGSVTLPGGATTTKAHVGLPFLSEANTLELDVGARDGSLMGRRKKVAKLILSLFETDTTGLRIQSMVRGAWETVRIPTVVPSNGLANLFTGNVEVPIDDSWEGQGRVRIFHDNPTPCTVRAITPVFDSEP